ncbi:diguanylate cyclase (GGDEF)-like protein [Sphingopyxis panaciterrae]|uniref:diguanylate cyclase n=1 Tax=Sphingopyxis panaciterrae TaxID=363841 RepID=UPI001421E9E5|nr:diguanylate cyclase [Sphingopyxis panaciterrae]NIJ36030.1 diguanylate cyclase (GGDEF)-like protein [Sphingopyxis panaciterrae]
MRLATITNWAYGATVVLTIVSSTTMILASNAQDRERSAVEQRYLLDQETAELGTDIYALSDRARQFVNTGDPTYLAAYRSEFAALETVEDRIRHIGDAGATAGELDALKKAVTLADTLHDEQQSALTAQESGNSAVARQILFGAEYERQLDRAELEVQRFQDRLDTRIETQVRDATDISRVWKRISEVVLALTALLVLFVLYFVFKQRVLHPVVKLSDVVNRLAVQDFAAEPPEISHIDEIGDMAQAIRIFRENGLERQRLETERDADRTMRDLLSRMTQRMQGCDTLHDLKEVVQRFVPEIVPDMPGRLYLLDRQRNLVVEACGWLGPVRSSAQFSALSCWALRRGLRHRPAGGNVDVPCDHIDWNPDHPVDTLCLPLTAQRETLGLLYFEMPVGGDTPAAAQLIYFDMLAENIGLAIANLQLRDTLREMAMADSLTGLANRRQLGDVLETQISQAERLGEPLGCLMIDVDHFKRFNDNHGHESGDTVLRAVGLVLANVTREAGLAFRYGGEEFLILLPTLSPVQAEERAEDIRTRISALQLGHGGNDLEPVTVSVGIAVAPDHCAYDRLVRTADAALLRAKTLGRDRIEMAKLRNSAGG